VTLLMGAALIAVAMIVAVLLIGSSGESLGDEIDASLKDYDAVVVLFYNEDPTGYVIIYELEVQYQSVRFIRVDCATDSDAAKEYDIETFPTVLVITSENKKGVVLEGPVNKVALTAAIEQALSGGP